MDDELKRRLAASLDQPGDTAADPEIAKVLSESTQARSYVGDLRVMDKALRNWPTPVRTSADWERMASAIEGRLGEPLSELPWDPLERPPFDNDENAMDAMEKSMAEPSDTNQDDDDLEGLAALTRTSVGPTRLSFPAPPSVRPGPALVDDGMPESSGVVDIKELAALAKRQESMPPVEPETKANSQAPAPSAKAKADAKEKAAEPAKSATTKTAAPKAGTVATVAPIKSGRRSAALWAGPLLAAAAVLVFSVWKQGTHTDAMHASGVDQTESASEPSTSAATPAPTTAPTLPVAAQPPAPPPPAAVETPPSGNSTVTGIPPQTPPTTASPAQTVEVTRPATTTLAPTPGAGAAPGEPAAAHPAVAATEPPAATGATVSANTHAEPAHSTTSEHRELAREEPAPHAAPAPNPEPERQPAQRAAPETTRQTAATSTSDTGGAAAPPPAQPAGAPAAHPSAPSGGSGGARSIDDLMAQAVGPRHGGGHGGAPATGSGSTEEAAPTAVLPERPTRAQVTATMSPLSSAVRACTQGQTGTATVAMMISHDGTVQSASVSGPFSPDANSCIAGVARRAHFPAFTRPTVPIVYPFSVQPRPGG